MSATGHRTGKWRCCLLFACALAVPAQNMFRPPTNPPSVRAFRLGAQERRHRSKN